MSNLQCTGDIGFCKFTGRTTAIELTWNDDTVIEIDCKHKICCHAEQCELYKKHPIGFHKTYPYAED